MGLDATIEKLRGARGDPRKLALAALDILLAQHDAKLRAAVEAAAIPHWFTPSILAALLVADEPTAAQYVDQLRQFAVVEPHSSPKRVECA